jgi:hypothetical protein
MFRVPAPLRLLLGWLLLAGLLGCGFGGRLQVLPNVSPSGDWLGRFNTFRAWGALDPIVADPTLAEGTALHSKWMVVNNTISHAETPGTECYTVAGDEAGRSSNVSVQAPTPTTVDVPMRGWMTGPFHGVAMIDPRLTASSFGHYVENNVFPGEITYGATLDVTSRRGGDVPPTAVRWPAPGVVIDVLSYEGHEQPDPVAPYGISAPTGLPVYLLLPLDEAYPPVYGGTSFSAGATSLGHLVYDGGTYVNPSPELQALGRSILAARRCVVLIPHAPLSPATTYDVSITTNGTTYAWSFATTGSARSAPRTSVRLTR